VSEEEQPDECDFCHWQTSQLHESPQPRYPGNGQPMSGTMGGWLCTVCYSTHASNVFHYPTSYPGASPTLSVVCWGINYLASLIKSDQ
jgi:hypothetical protein